MKAGTECIVINGADWKGSSERRFVNIKQKWNLEKQSKAEGFCNFTLPVILICNLGLTEAQRVPLADHSI